LDWQPVAGFLVGLLVATVTSPVGVSGAVFLLPVQLSVFAVPSPQVTPTNLLYNVISGPGALLRFGRRGLIDARLTGDILIGAVPGMVLGAAARVWVVADPNAFRLVAAAVLAPIGVLILRGPRATAAGSRHGLSPTAIRSLAFGIGIAGGVYGIGGGSVLGPILVGSGLAIGRVAPAALASTWITSIVGVSTYALISLRESGPIAPDWALGMATGLGGLVGGWLGASLQPHLPERALRGLLGFLALFLAALYVVQVLRAT
jgi:uncharacterized membrane protein YfcA